MPLVAAGTALALMVLIVVTTAQSTPILHSPDRDPDVGFTFHRTGFTPPSFPGARSRQPDGKGAQEGSHILGTIFRDVLLALVVLGLLWATVSVTVAVVRRWRRRRRRTRQDDLPEMDDAVLVAVDLVTRRQEQQLHEGAPSNAVVACWVDLEQSVAGAGVQRRPSETSAELTIRVLDALDVDRGSLRTLGALYREARYSAHPLTEHDRTAALDALRTLRRSLPAAPERV